MFKPKIAIVTSTRADYGKLKSIILNLQSNKNFKIDLFVTGQHNLKLYGNTIVEIKKDKVKNIHTFKNQTQFSSMNEILSNTIKGFTDYLIKNKPSLVIVHGDRVEPLSCAISSILMNFKLAHIEGGELSGTVDEIMRHAISKLSHLHFVTNKTAKKRLLQMGEENKSIHIVGSPDVDIILGKNLPSMELVKKRYDIEFDSYAISLFHPVTTNLEKFKKEIKIYFSALVESKKNFIMPFPNNDVGSKFIMKEISKIKKNKNFKFLPSFRFEYFLTLLKNSKLIIGNSSSGIMEAPYYGVQTINVGDRQKNRLLAPSILNLDFNKKIIINNISKNFGKKHKKKKYFGFGNSHKKVSKLINSKIFLKLNQQKTFVELEY